MTERRRPAKLCNFKRKGRWMVCTNPWCDQPALPDVGQRRYRSCPLPADRDGSQPPPLPEKRHQYRPRRRMLPRPGDVLAWLIWLATGEVEDLDAGCGCRRMRRMMNVNGWGWSWTSRREIRNYLERKAAERGIYTVPRELRPILWSGMAIAPPMLRALVEARPLVPR